MRMIVSTVSRVASDRDEAIAADFDAGLEGLDRQADGTTT